MEIAVIGVNHHTAPISIREKVSFAETKKVEIYNELLDKFIDEAVIVSTCNRSEIYICAKQIEEKIPIIIEIYRRQGGTNFSSSFLFIKKREDVYKHLYDVTAGLDSLVIGEDQILGQVKEAHQLAMEVGSSKKIFNKLFREAITTAKKIKTETKISQYPLSISSIGVQFIKEKMGELKGKTILLVGAGKMNQLALNYLVEEEAGKIYIANRTKERVLPLLMSYKNVFFVPYKKRYDVMEEIDVLFSSTAAPHSVITKEKMPLRKKPLYILDMALPRDVEQQVKNEKNIFLYDIDHLKEIASENEKIRSILAKKAESYIQESIEAFCFWKENISLDPTIHSLQERCTIIHEDTMKYLNHKIMMSSKEEKIIDKMLMSALKRLIREPIQHLKKTRDKTKQTEYIKLVEELFDLSDKYT